MLKTYQNTPFEYVNAFRILITELFLYYTSLLCDTAMFGYYDTVFSIAFGHFKSMQLIETDGEVEVKGTVWVKT